MMTKKDKQILSSPKCVTGLAKLHNAKDKATVDMKSNSVTEMIRKAKHPASPSLQSETVMLQASVINNKSCISP